MSRKKRKPKSARTSVKTSKKTPKKWGRRVALSFILLVVLGCLSPYLVVWGASAGRFTTLDDVEPHDVAIVFGAGLFGDQPSPYLRGRLVMARDLYATGKAQVLLLTGDNLTRYHNEPEVMRTWLIEYGVPADRIVTDHAGEDTYSSCVRATKIFGVDKAILVTQTYHMPRAIATCRLVGLDVVGVGDDTVREQNPVSWSRYRLREIPAIANMLFEVVSKREPILGPYETSVDTALGR